MMFTIFILGCATPPPHSKIRPSVNVEDLLAAQTIPSKIALKEEFSDSHSYKLETVSQNFTFGKIPLELNESVQKWILYFSQKDRLRFQRFLNQGSRYREIVENLLEENELPPELYYLAMIESGYSTRATSIAKAAGVWQFIPATGQRYGLEINLFTDERRDPIRATEAATKYLKDLYNVFGSWYLAIAAYNAGEYRIMGAVLRGKSRDFWVLAKNGVLPSETADYIPKFLAAITIGENPSQFGFEVPHSEKFPDLEAVEVPSPIHLSDLADLSKLSLDELKRMNPNLRGDMTPPNTKSYEIWLPADRAINFENQKLRLAQLRIQNPKFTTSPQIQLSLEEKRNYHVVRNGETLLKVAATYKVSSTYLRKLNHLSTNRVLPGTKLRITAKSYTPTKSLRYRVKRGDRLIEIAKKYNTSVQAIKAANSMRRNKIYAGQVLRIRQNGV